MAPSSHTFSHGGMRSRDWFSDRLDMNGKRGDTLRGLKEVTVIFALTKETDKNETGRKNDDSALYIKSHKLESYASFAERKVAHYQAI